MAPLIAWSLPAEARDERREIAIEPGTLPEALNELSRETDISIGTDGTLPHVATKAVRGRMTAERALRRILQGSGMVARQVGPTAWRIEPVRERAIPAPRAATAAPPPATFGTDIIVTGTKRRLSLDSTPDAVSVVLPGQVLGVRAGDGTAAVARQVDGLTLTGEGPGRNRIFLRGVADSPFSGHSQSTIAVLLDDSRLTYAAPDPDVRLVDVERVEVLKGPQGSLYGTGALGGIYRVVSRRADPTQTDFALSASTQAVAHGRVGVGGSAMANLPLVADRIAVRLVGYGERAPGWIDTGDRRDSNASDLTGVRGGLGIEAGGGWRIDLTGLGQWLGVDDSSYVYRDEIYRRPAQLPERHDNDLVHASVRAAREGGSTTFVMSSGYTVHEVDNRYDATFGAAALGLPDPQLLDDDNHYTVWDNELRATGRLGRLSWLAGVSHLQATQRSTRELTGRNNSSLLVDSDHRKAVETGMFGELTLPLTSTLSATAGARVFRSLIEEERAEGSLAADRHLVRYGVTPSAGLAWQPRRGRLLYLHYGSAFRQGGTGITEDGEIDTLDGDELATLAAGWRETRGALRFDLGLYRSWWSSIQSDVLRSNGLIETANVGDGSITGAELSIEADLGAGWRARGGAMAQSALLDLQDAPPGIGDRRLPVVPSSRLRGSVAKDWALGAWDLTAEAGLDYTARARLSFDPALDRPMGDVLDGSMGLSARRGHISASLEVRNLLGGHHDSFAYGNPLRILAMPQHVPQQPRTVELTLTWR